MTPATGARTLRVAAVQVPSRNGAIAENLAHAEAFVAEAARQGAALVLLPEFLPTGYLLAPEIWHAAEPAVGPTVRWLSAQALRHGVFVGTSFLEADGDDFINTFVLAAPDGSEAGRVWKQTPAVFEAFVTRGRAGPHVIDTGLGRIVVGICYENQLAYLPRLCAEQGADLVLMPHSAPSPTRSNRVTARKAAIYDERLRAIPEWFAAELGVPVVMANKSGPWLSPIPLIPFATQDSTFPGLSKIVDSDGRVLAALGDEEGLVVADVTIDPARRRAAPKPFGHWARPVPRATEMLRVTEAVGALSYRLRRAQRARAAAAVRAADGREPSAATISRRGP